MSDQDLRCVIADLTEECKGLRAALMQLTDRNRLMRLGGVKCRQQFDFDCPGDDLEAALWDALGPNKS